ncbi:ParB/RepB/Spo0J family partition protein [Geopseudomonas aromaticivorans]
MKSSSPLGKGHVPGFGVPTKPTFHGVPAPDQEPIKANLSTSQDEVLRKAGLANVYDNGGEELVAAAGSTKEHSDVVAPAVESAGDVGRQVVCLDVALLDASPYQPRLTIEPERLKELALSISSNGGLNNPIIVRPKANGRFEVVCGHRRWAAVETILGENKIDALVRDLTDARARVLAALDNHDEDLTDYEYGRAYRDLLDAGAVKTQTELCLQMGIGNALAHRRLSYTYLPAPVRLMLDENPKLIGVAVVSGFARLTKDGRGDLVLEAAKKIAAGEVSQERALAWAEFAEQRINQEEISVELALEEARQGSKLATSTPKAEPALEPLSVGDRVIAKSAFKAKGRRLVLDFEDAKDGADLFAAFKEFLKQRENAS